MKIFLAILLFGVSSQAFAANHFVCYKKTGRTTYESEASALVVPIERDLKSGAVLTYLKDSRPSRTFVFNGTSTSTHTGIEWTDMMQVAPEEIDGHATNLSMESTGFKRLMEVETMVDGVILFEVESFICEEESSI